VAPATRCGDVGQHHIDVSTPAIDWRWIVRSEAPAPLAAVAWAEAARKLLARLFEIQPDVQARLAVSASRDVIIVTGSTADLPWVEGLEYAAPCVEAGDLWLPTVQQPDVPAALLSRALQKQHRRTPLLLWPSPAAVVPLDRQRPATPANLTKIRTRWAEG